MLGYNCYNDDGGTYTGRYNVLFYNYNYKAFFIGLLLGLAFIFLPKLWRGNGENSMEKRSQEITRCPNKHFMLKPFHILCLEFNCINIFNVLYFYVFMTALKGDL